MDQELYKKNRQNVYWINFGRNIGSEFQDYHYALVIYESKYTALVVPLTSKKDHTPKWIEENKEVIVDIGKIEGYPDEMCIRDRSASHWSQSRAAATYTYSMH